MPRARSASLTPLWIHVDCQSYITYLEIELGYRVDIRTGGGAADCAAER